LLRIFSKTVTESLPNLFLAGSGDLTRPERLDRGSMSVEPDSGIKEVEIEYPHEGIQQGLQDSTRFADTPDGWKRKDADQIVHATLQPLYFSRRIR
jgi:hypothetical protein